MSYCPHCGADVASSARFCSACGGDPQTTGANPLPPRSPGASSKAGRQPPSPRRILALSMISLPIWVALLYFVTQGPSSCASAEGKLVASGEALGDFTLTPTQCRSGEHEQFFGVYLLPEANNKGGVKIVKDPTSGYRVTIEKPGSCKEDVCEVVEVTAEGCETFKVRVVPQPGLCPPSTHRAASLGAGLNAGVVHGRENTII